MAIAVVINCTVVKKIVCIKSPSDAFFIKGLKKFNSSVKVLVSLIAFKMPSKFNKS